MNIISENMAAADTFIIILIIRALSVFSNHSLGNNQRFMQSYM